MEKRLTFVNFSWNFGINKPLKLKIMKQLLTIKAYLLSKLLIQTQKVPIIIGI